MKAQPAPKMGSVAEVPQPILKVPIVLITPKVEPSILTEVPTATFTKVPPPSFTLVKVPASIEVISLEDDVVAALAKAPQADV
ncbi:hypothetical protein COCNU_13G006190 [Cocos nucifera]|uniref:Uncharacterized protein n=1 Tax=Cocos nucifera TaxID=13894 RepID=A0A8K0ITD5_COCNU|nr:hypothetical protein COCNU_13G006190 [Cocos nucifera]